ncbi:MAG TPA: hypothetical protein VHR86_02350 [Armatimonadota bacterium]|nr:hypothetical protein [Armatimonadota bacterium]
MPTYVWLFLAVVCWMALLPFVVYVAFRGRAERPAEREDAVAREILPEEWDVTLRRYCRPGRCSRLRDGRQPRDQHCAACAALFMERYWDGTVSSPIPTRRMRQRILSTAIVVALVALFVLRLPPVLILALEIVVLALALWNAESRGDSRRPDGDCDRGLSRRHN